MIKQFLTAIVLTASCITNAQVTVFVTEDNSKNESGTAYENYKNWSNSGSNVTISLIDKGGES